MILIVSRMLFSFPGSKMPGIAYMSPAHGKEEIDLNCLSCPWLFGTMKEDRPWPRTVFSSKTVPEIPAQMVFKQIELMIRLLFFKKVFITLETTIAFPWLKACTSADHHCFPCCFGEKLQGEVSSSIFGWLKNYSDNIISGAIWETLLVSDHSRKNILIVWVTAISKVI